MTTQEALISLGVSPELLSAEQKNSLDTHGFVLLHQVLTQEEVKAICDRQQELLNAEGDKAGTEVHQEAGTDRLSNLFDKGEAFRVIFRKPLVLAAVAHVLDYDLKLSSLNSRAAKPGQGLQALHPDWGRNDNPNFFQVCNTLWMLDDFTATNGATRVVPGTHRSNKVPADEMKSAMDTHPREQIVLGKAGDVVVLNSHTWHGGTLNQTDKPRRAMHGYFTRSANTQQTDQRKFLSPGTIGKLGQPVKVMLGLE